MTTLRSPDEVIRALPDWQGATRTKLDGGLTNQTWLLEKDGNKAVLKIDAEPRRAPYNDRLAEAEVQTAAAKAGLAGQVIFADRQVYLTEFVDGAAWDPADLDKESRIEQLASALRRLHSLPKSGRSFDARGAAKLYVQDIENPDKKLIATCLKIIKKVRLPNYLCCCHNDLVANNIIAAPDLKFLDWEYACDNNPLFDLATIVEHHEVGEAHARALLDAYFDGSGESWYEQLVEQQQLYLALLWLWLASRPDSSNKAVKLLGERVATSCS
ncbi:MAG: phosphotransferase family protein [Gammaproteobacteria bacterium]|nr:phosphotransferase family protein [Gammaproteobacteria bacterium]MBT8110679.1 phosphotransferase family protein [Gammaproteobacteria bacterium]NND48534.1 phosphotransferase family protein [Woeseiaceae bacterium]NNL45378.1 phosphotransferase family protein [Woeseiaceae bacterium]